MAPSPPPAPSSFALSTLMGANRRKWVVDSTLIVGKPRTWETARKEKIPKVVRRGCKRFWTQGAKVTQESFAPPKPSFAPVRNGVAPVQEAFHSPGPKDLLHPLLTTFGDFLFSGSFPAPWLPKLIDVYRQSAAQWQKVSLPNMRKPSQKSSSCLC